MSDFFEYLVRENLGESQGIFKTDLCGNHD